VALAGFIKDTDSSQAMFNLATSQSIEKWTIATPDGATWAFDAFVKSFKEAEATVDGVRGFSASLRISGEPTYTPADVSV